MSKRRLLQALWQYNNNKFLLFIKLIINGQITKNKYQLRVYQFLVERLNQQIDRKRTKKILQ